MTTTRLAPIVLALAAGLAAFSLARTRLTALEVTPTSTRVLDFAYYANLTRAFWAGEADNPYAADTLIRVFGELAGRPTEQAMPVGVAPSAFLLWWPFGELAARDLGLAHAAWVGVSVAAAVAALAGFSRDGRGRLPPAAGLFLLAAGLSVTGYQTAALGQITPVAVAALVLLWRPASRRAPDGWADAAAVAGLLLVLAIKPTYLLLGLVSLGVQRRWRAGAVGLAVVVAVNLAVLATMAPGALADLRAALAIYSTGRVPPHFADTFVPATMASFTSAFGPLLGVPASFLVARVLGGAGLLAVAGLVAWGRLPPPTLFAAAVGVVLLCSPYLGAYEDLLLLAVVGVLVRADAGFPRPTAVGWLLVLTAAVLFYNRPAVLPGVPPLVPWLLKLVMVAGLVRVSRRPAGG
jgi:hypothetical protein